MKATFIALVLVNCFIAALTGRVSTGSTPPGHSMNADNPGHSRHNHGGNAFTGSGSVSGSASSSASGAISGSATVR